MLCLFCWGWHCRVLTRFFFFGSNGSDTVLCHAPFTNSWQRQQKRRARRLVTTWGETSVLKQRLSQIQRWGVDDLTSVTYHTFADAWGRSLRNVPLGWSPLISPPCFLSVYDGCSCLGSGRLDRSCCAECEAMAWCSHLEQHLLAPAALTLCLEPFSTTCFAPCGLLLTHSSSQVSAVNGRNLMSILKIMLLESLSVQSLNLCLQL